MAPLRFRMRNLLLCQVAAQEYQMSAKRMALVGLVGRAIFRFLHL